MAPRASVTRAIAAMGLLAAMSWCTGAGSGNAQFTHPYTGPQGSNTGTPDATPSPGASGTTSSDGNGSLLAGATPGTSTASIAGTVKGVGFTPVAAFFDATGSDPNTPLALTMVLSDNANFCTTLVSQGNIMANSNYALVQALALDDTSSATALTAGSYNIVLSGALAGETAAGNYASFDFFRLDDQCEQSLADSYYRALSGSLTLATLVANPNGPSATGNIAVSLGSQKDTLGGQFGATACPGLHNITGSPNTFGCQ